MDMYNAERIDLEDVLTISAWPAFARNRFLRAWQALRDAGRAAALAADEGTAELVLPAGPGNPPTVATVATQTPGVIVVPTRPAPAAARAALKRRDRNHRGGPSLGPRDARGCFPCPAGCPRTFAHAPAAVHHGKSCTAGGARPPGAAAPPETNRDDETAEEAAGAELTEAEVRGALQAAGGRMKTKDLLVFKARLKANPANKDATSACRRGGRRRTPRRRRASGPGPMSRTRSCPHRRVPGGTTMKGFEPEDAGHSYAPPKRAAEQSPRAAKRPRRSWSPLAGSAGTRDGPGGDPRGLCQGTGPRDGGGQGTGPCDGGGDPAHRERSTHAAPQHGGGGPARAREEAVRRYARARGDAFDSTPHRRNRGGDDRRRFGRRGPPCQEGARLSRCDAGAANPAVSFRSRRGG